MSRLRGWIARSNSLRSIATQFSAQGAKTILAIAITVIAVTPSWAQTESRSLAPGDLSFADPFVKACDDSMECIAQVQSDRIKIVVRMKDQIRLSPRRGTGLRPGDTTGIWEAEFFLVPKISRQDMALIQSQEFGLGELDRGTNSYILGDVRQGEYVYKVKYVSYRPAKATELAIVENFARRLSEVFTAANGGPASPIFAQRITDR